MAPVPHAAAVALLLCCSTADEATRVSARAIDLDLQTTKEHLSTVEQLLWATRAEVARLNAELDDARILTLIGGPPRRWQGDGASCDGGRYLAGSLGEAAHRALKATGYCDPSESAAHLVKR